MSFPKLNLPSSSSTLAAPKQGFALVIALGLMAFVLLLLLSISTLVTVESQSSGINKSRLEAEQAALLAMRIAIGELQTTTGLDTRVTASSTLINENSVPVTGVWRSWEGSDRDNDGKPIAPIYSAKRVAGNLDAANPVAGLDVSSNAGRFLGWLTSAELSDDPDDPIPPEVLSNVSGEGRVAMLTSGTPNQDEGSVAIASEELYILPTYLREGDAVTGSITGSMAWWISGDNAKAMINDDPNEEPSTVQEWQQRVRSNGWADPAAFEFGDDDIFNDKELPSTKSLALVADSGAEVRRFHDVTSFNRGLLTNTAVGGWRRDMSLVTESYDGDTSDGDPATYSTTQPLPSGRRSRGYPFYTPQPGEITLARKATETDKSAGALLYPWATYRDHVEGWGHTGPIGSWTSLVDYSNQYKNLQTFSSSKTKFPVSSGTVDWPQWSEPRLPWADKIRVAPIISRVHWVFSLASEGIGRRTVRYTPQLLLTPAVTIWNPYNVELEVPSNLNLKLNWRGQVVAPLKFKISVDGQPLYEVTGDPRQDGISFDQLFEGTSDVALIFPTSGSITLPPGASKMFSVNTTVPQDGSVALELHPGYAAQGGFVFDILDFSSGSDDGVPVTYDASAQISIEGVNISGGYDDSGVGVYANIHAGTGSDKARFPIRNIFTESEIGGTQVLEENYPSLPLDDLGDLYSDVIENFDLSSGQSRAFVAAIFANRATSPIAAFDEPEFAHLATKGMLQSNPLCYYVEMRSGSHRAHGSRHPVNGNYAFSFRVVDGWNSPAFGWLPQVDDDNTGDGSYIVSGLDSSSGLTRCIMAELPTRPIQSLVDLQHWDARNNNAYPPFQFNLIGNASATPLIPADEVSVIGTSAYGGTMCNDDSYLLNHVLFDDWFVSSIAPDYGDFGGVEKRGIGEVYEEHLTGEETLPNRFYLPVEKADASNSAAETVNIVSGIQDPETGKYGFEFVASKLSVAGMFNVNSTSVDAWRALLRHSRDVEVPYLDSNGNTRTDEARSFTFSRTSIAGDRGSDSGTIESGLLAADFAGHRVLTEGQIDRLAEYIVDEIRERGPFLSLSEFVNRQLTTDTDLALAGTVQSALDQLAGLGGAPENPFRELQENSVEITSIPSGNHEYEFDEAALGYSAFGVPGWTRQADVLRPLAPILSARDDTFTIRSYGDVRDPINPDTIISRVWCEAVVVRTADFVDSIDDSSVLPHSSDMESAVNERFGRKYKIASFRWLNEGEI
ncbi:MAG: hypothetical protein ACSHYA_06415 [Opitutaceae bacterium]